MTMAFVLGNGVSRRGLDLNLLGRHGKIYGCNALYREFVPDVLVATDRPIADAIQASGYAAHNRFYTRSPWPDSGALRVPQQYRPFASGATAAALAAMDQHHKIYLLGFDLGADRDQLFNNVYASTEFYKKTGSTPTYAGNWIEQLCCVVKDFSQQQFVRVCGPTTADIAVLNTLPNLAHEDLTSFASSINNL
jgi:hypothetical protein